MVLFFWSVNKSFIKIGQAKDGKLSMVLWALTMLESSDILYSLAFFPWAALKQYQI